MPFNEKVDLVMSVVAIGEPYQGTRRDIVKIMMRLSENGDGDNVCCMMAFNKTIPKLLKVVKLHRAYQVFHVVKKTGNLYFFSNSSVIMPLDGSGVCGGQSSVNFMGQEQERVGSRSSVGQNSGSQNFDSSSSPNLDFANFMEQNSVRPSPVNSVRPSSPNLDFTNFMGQNSVNFASSSPINLMSRNSERPSSIRPVNFMGQNSSSVSSSPMSLNSSPVRSSPVSSNPTTPIVPINPMDFIRQLCPSPLNPMTQDFINFIIHMNPNPTRSSSSSSSPISDSSMSPNFTSFNFTNLGPSIPTSDDSTGSSSTASDNHAPFYYSQPY